MTTNKQSELGKTLWSIANDLRGAMMADDFRDYMLSFLFWKYLSDNYIKAAQKELGADYHTVTEEKQRNGIQQPHCVFGMKRIKTIHPCLRNRCVVRFTM